MQPCPEFIVVALNIQKRRPPTHLFVIYYALFLRTLLPAAGPSIAFGPAASFFPAAQIAIVFLAAAGWAFVAFFTTVVAFEVPDMLLVLLTDRTSTAFCVAATPRFGLVTADLAEVVGFVALRPEVAADLVDFNLSTTRFAKLAVAVAAAALAGDGILIGD